MSKNKWKGISGNWMAARSLGNSSVPNWESAGLLVAVRFAAGVRSSRLPFMLFMVIERFKNGDTKSIGERFAREGRMLPPGVIYHASWVDAVGGRCFQIMEADRVELLAEWVRCWEDLVEFEIVPVVTSAEFWSKAASK